MASERHLPGGKRHEEQPVGGEVVLDVAQEKRLVANVLYDVVAEDEVETVAELGQLEYVAGNKFALGPGSLKLGAGNIDARGGHVNAKHTASVAGKGQQVASVATTYLQHAKAWLNGAETPDIGHEIALAGLGQFAEIAGAVFLTFLHGWLEIILVGFSAIHRECFENIALRLQPLDAARQGIPEFV